MKDQLGRQIQLNKTPQRIVSIVPSQTELLFDLGLDEEIVGITKFCVHPAAWFKNKKRIGGTKKINIDAVSALLPDIVFANKEENTKEDIEKLEAICPVWVSDIHHLNEALDMIISIGNITGKRQEADIIAADITKAKRAFPVKEKKAATLYLIWKKPYMAAGTDTFIHEMMDIAGFQNVLTDKRYPVIDTEEMQKLNPAYVLLSSEPYPFKQKDIEELSEILPDAKIILVDGKLFSWYGSRLLKSFDYFSTLHEHTI